MTNKELADKLELHQRWRRGELEEMPMGPKELGLLIDEIIDRLRDDRMRAMLEELATCGAIPNGVYVTRIKNLLKSIKRKKDQKHETKTH